MQERQTAETAADVRGVAALVDAANADTSLSFLAELDAPPGVAIVDDDHADDDSEYRAQAPADEFPVVVDDLLLDEIVLLGIQEDLRGPLPPSTDAAECVETASSSTLPLPVESPHVVTPPPPPPPPASTKEPKPKVHSRVRQREEMAYLRTQVLELEAELRRLKDGDGSSSSSSSPSLDTTEIASAPSSSSSDTAAVWEQVAKRQMAAKHRAEVENLKLRALVEGQLRVAKSLEKLLRKRQNSEAEELFAAPKRLRVSAAEAAAAQSIYDMLRPRLPSRFAELDEVLASAGLADVWCDLDDCRTNVDEQDGAIYMEMVLARVLPFDVGASADAVWKCLSAPHVPLQSGYYGAQAISEDECNVHFVVNLRLRRTVSEIHVDGVGRRRLVHNGAATEMAWESVGVADGRLFGGRPIRCRERGYITVVRIPDRPNACIVKSVVRMWPDIDYPEGDEDNDVGAGGGSSMTDDTVGLFVDLVIGSFNVNTKTMLQVVENALLGGAMTM